MEGAVSPALQAEQRLNAALQQAALVAERSGATALLVLHNDLQLLTSAALAAFIRAGLDGQSGGERRVIIAPDRHGQGTNALLLRPPRAIQFAFGAQSFGRHLALAREAGVVPVVHRDPRFAIDLDTPEDLDLLYTLAPDLEPLAEASLSPDDHQEPDLLGAGFGQVFLAGAGRRGSGAPR
jgi:2-phospho-L-lactate guanylyltransferase